MDGNSEYKGEERRKPDRFTASLISQMLGRLDDLQGSIIELNKDMINEVKNTVGSEMRVLKLTLDNYCVKQTAINENLIDRVCKLETTSMALDMKVNQNAYDVDILRKEHKDTDIEVKAHEEKIKNIINAPGRKALAAWVWVGGLGLSAVGTIVTLILTNVIHF